MKKMSQLSSKLVISILGAFLVALFFLVKKWIHLANLDVYSHLSGGWKTKPVLDEVLKYTQDKLLFGIVIAFFVVYTLAVLAFEVRRWIRAGAVRNTKRALWTFFGMLCVVVCSWIIISSFEAMGGGTSRSYLTSSLVAAFIVVGSFNFVVDILNHVAKKYSEEGSFKPL